MFIINVRNKSIVILHVIRLYSLESILPVYIINQILINLMVFRNKRVRNRSILYFVFLDQICSLSNVYATTRRRDNRNGPQIKSHSAIERAMFGISLRYKLRN